MISLIYITIYLENLENYCLYLKRGIPLEIANFYKVNRYLSSSLSYLYFK